MVNYSCESLNALKGVTPAGGVKYSCEALDVVPGEEGFWESFWRNGLLVAVIQACQAQIGKIRNRCESFVANPQSWSNYNLDTDIRAMKILPKNDMLTLIKGLKNLGDLLKKNANDMSKAKREDFMKALNGTGIQVTWDSVKGQYKWDCGSLWGSWGVGILLSIGTLGFYGYLNSVTAGMLQRKMQLGLHKIPAIMSEKGYVDTNDYKDLCKAVADLCKQATEMANTSVNTENVTEKSMKAIIKASVSVYQREVKEICYAMVKVLNGLGDPTGVLAWW